MIKTPTRIRQRGSENMGRDDQGYEVLDAEGKSLTGWGQVTTSKEKAQFISDCINEAVDLRSERDEADRRAGAAERMLSYANEALSKQASWTDAKKARLGYDDRVSFDIVFDDLITLLGGWTEARRKCCELPDERRR